MLIEEEPSEELVKVKDDDLEEEWSVRSDGYLQFNAVVMLIEEEPSEELVKVKDDDLEEEWSVRSGIPKVCSYSCRLCAPEVLGLACFCSDVSQLDRTCFRIIRVLDKGFFSFFSFCSFFSFFSLTQLTFLQPCCWGALV
jgi:hypothetical protein